MKMYKIQTLPDLWTCGIKMKAPNNIPRISTSTAIMVSQSPAPRTSY